ncbi:MULTISPECIES: hypothetical protein [unclassified Nocardioides]|uniref:hypothetical protein n=1 Tax=unclassified Nocardioides TaxID=2615069 RepID=UPI00301559D8
MMRKTTAAVALTAATALTLPLAPTSASAAPDGGTGTEPYVTAGKPGQPGARGITAAEDSPTVQELLDKCDSGDLDVCEFHPSGETISQGEFKFAGSAANCAADSQTREINWSSTEGETNSLGITLGVKAGLKDVYEVSIETTYGHEWTWSKTTQDKLTQTVSPGKAVNLYVAADRSTVTGTYEMHFGDPYYGHYYWYVNDVSVSAPTFNTPWHTRTEETDANC